MNTDTIAAIASGLTQSGIGIIRISGSDAVAVADRVFFIKNKKLADMPSHTIHYGVIRSGGEKIDEGIALIMLAPHSYTAEDVVEIQCHGGPLVMRKTLQAVLQSGARLAEPGEFTKRAFLNGRIDLSQAEAVMDVIRAQNDFALHSSVSQLSGMLSEKIRKMRSEILYEVAHLEAALDDPEHLPLDGYSEHLADVLHQLISEISDLIRHAESSEKLSEGIRTVILGRPNAGKSSLLNCLLGEERAIVTDIAGTTRDTLEESIRLDGFSLRLVDTAGIRKTNNIVEKMGVSRAMQQAEDADLILYVVDSSSHLDENDKEIIHFLKGRKAIVLMNKSDLPPVLDRKQLMELTGQPVIAISAREGTGMEEFRQKAAELFDIGEIGKNDQIAVTSVRHREALADALHSLELVERSIDDQMPEDFYTIDLMDAYRSLGSIIGEEVGEDLINEIFSKFCMGK